MLTSSPETDTVIVTLNTQKQRLAQGHRASPWQVRDLNLGRVARSVCTAPTQEAQGAGSEDWEAGAGSIGGNRRVGGGEECSPGVLPWAVGALHLPARKLRLWAAG